MHKPIFILVDCKKSSEVSAIAEEFLDRLIEDGSHDWYQGLKDSGRWAVEYYYFDKPKLVSNNKSQAIIDKFLTSQELEIMTWLRRGEKDLKDIKIEFGWALNSYHIASNDIPIHLFDATTYSEGTGIKDKLMMKHIIEYTKSKLWIKGYDIHY